MINMNSLRLKKLVNFSRRFRIKKTENESKKYNLEIKPDKVSIKGILPGFSYMHGHVSGVSRRALESNYQPASQHYEWCREQTKTICRKEISCYYIYELYRYNSTVEL